MNNSEENKMSKQEWLEKNAGRFMVSDGEEITYSNEEKEEK